MQGEKCHKHDAWMLQLTTLLHCPCENILPQKILQSSSTIHFNQVAEKKKMFKENKDAFMSRDIFLSKHCKNNSWQRPNQSFNNTSHFSDGLFIEKHVAVSSLSCYKKHVEPLGIVLNHYMYKTQSQVHYLAKYIKNDLYRLQDSFVHSLRSLNDVQGQASSHYIADKFYLPVAYILSTKYEWHPTRGFLCKVFAVLNLSATYWCSLVTDIMPSTQLHR